MTTHLTADQLHKTTAAALPTEGAGQVVGGAWLGWVGVDRDTGHVDFNLRGKGRRRKKRERERLIPNYTLLFSGPFPGFQCSACKTEIAWEWAWAQMNINLFNYHIVGKFRPEKVSPFCPLLTWAKVLSHQIFVLYYYDYIKPTAIFTKWTKFIPQNISAMQE